MIGNYCAISSLTSADPEQCAAAIKSSIDEKGYWLSTEDESGRLKTLLNTKLYIIPHIPTSERLAEHFFGRLKLPVGNRAAASAS